jgi:hypothetical protein
MLDRLRAALDLRHPRYRSVFRNREGGRTILALLGMLIVVAAVLFVIGRIDTMRRSGTAVVTIVSTRFQPGSAGLRETPQGSQIQYQYTVDGATYTGADFRSWTDVSAHEPKVCYEPADPSNHLLVDGRIRCGVDAGP